jgi:spermidine/putrescine-binding protein
MKAALLRATGGNDPASTLALALMLLLAVIGLPRPVLAAERPVLRILGWGDSLDPTMLAESGRRHGVKVEETCFNSDTECDRMLAADGATGFDLAIVDAAQVVVYRDRGWIEPLGEAGVPGLRELDARWHRIAAGTATHAFPLACGTVGIGYRADLVQTAPEFWHDLFKLDAATCGVASYLTAMTEPNVPGRALLPAAIRNDKAIYPSDADLKAAEQIQRQSAAIVSKVNQIFAKTVPRN